MEKERRSEWKVRKRKIEEGRWLLQTVDNSQRRVNLNFAIEAGKSSLSIL